MRKIAIFAVLLLFAATLSGCTAVGAGVGAAIDRQNPWRGAAIGAAIGATMDVANAQRAQKEARIRNSRGRTPAKRSAAYIAGQNEAKKQRQAQQEQADYIDGYINEGGGVPTQTPYIPVAPVYYNNWGWGIDWRRGPGWGGYPRCDWRWSNYCW